MTQIVPLHAHILDDGSVFVMGTAPEVIGLAHLLSPTDSLFKPLLDCIKINREAHHKGPKPEREMFTR